jgi:DNA-directed RNA polymerase specialized sigma24 family protein
VTAAEKNRKWVLTDEAFSVLLDTLAEDRDRAAARYEALRTRLIRFFGWERCPAAPDLADEVLNRLAKRLQEGERVEAVEKYVYGIARMVLREVGAKSERNTAAIGELLRLTHDQRNAEPRFLGRVVQCLARLSPQEREFILEYYTGDGRQRIENRRKMASRLNLPLNAVRNRALRLRERLERCSAECMRRNDL